jgi:hypothetical protein
MKTGESVSENLSSADQDALGLFHAVIREKKNTEASLRTTAHFEDLNPDELSFEDFELFQRIVLGIGPDVSVKEFEAFRLRPKENRSRVLFTAYLANILAGRGQFEESGRN